jgi:Domain of Unknown Function (DUF748)
MAMNDAANAAPARDGAGGRRFVGSRPFKLGLIAVLLVGAYALIGFYAVPKWIRIAAVDAVQAQLGMPLGLGEIRVNPFLFTLEVRDIALPDAARGEPVVALDRLFVDFESSSLWHRALVFRDIALGGPFARVIILPDGSVNLARLAPQTPAEPEPAPAAESALPALWIQALEVTAGRVNFADRSLRETPEMAIAAIEFALRDFRTNPEGGAASLDARSEDGEGFAWEGRISLTPVSSQGHFSITALKARTVWEFLSEQLPAELTSGSIDLTGSYEFALDPAPDFKLELPEIKISQLDLKARDADAPWVQVDGVTVSDTAVTNRDQSVRVGALAIDGVAVDAWLEPDGSLNLLRLAGSQSGATAAEAGAATTEEPAAAPDEAQAPESATPPPADTPATQDTSGDWSVELAQLAINGANIAFEDRTFTPPNPTKVGPMALTASGLSLDLSRRIGLTLEATINDRGLLTVKGDLAPDPLAGDLDVAYRKGSILVAQPYVSRLADITVREGAFEVDGKLALRPAGTADPWLAFAGNFAATDLHTVDNVQQQDLINFERLDAKGIEFALAPDKLVIDEVAVTKPFARVIIESDQTINVVQVFETDGTAASRTEAPAQEENGKTSPQAKQSATASEEGTFPVTIGKVTVKGGTLDFSDFFIKPNFQARIDALNGHIARMSSDPSSHAKLEFNGQVISEYSPVSITGDMNLFSFDRHTDVDMQFRNIDLPVFNPYSGKFAGYAIAKGKLTTELSYEIKDRQLDAQHHIQIDQLEWGEKTDSKDAVSLPLKLATALLKDRNGLIDLDVPIGGSLDDPTFKLGPIIWKVVKNLLVKIVTAPFAFIGSLFQGAENAQFVTFAAGSAELTPENAESLAALAKALLERPQLKLDIPTRRMPEVDRPALIQRQYDEALGTAAAIAAGKGADAPVDFAALTPDKQLEALTGMYTVLAGSLPQTPEPPAPPEGTSRSDAKALALEHAIDYLKEANRSLIEITDDALRELAETRAQAIQKTLLASAAIDPERVFITGGDKVTVDGDRVKLELGLE